MLLVAGAILPPNHGGDVDAQPLKIGLVYESAIGAGDLSFNWMANEGLLRAETDLGVVGTTYTPASEADYEPLLQQCVDEGNALCLSVGYAMADATWDAAVANPDVDFAIVDHSWEAPSDNLRGMIFAADQAGYLAGTLAGLMTGTNVVGVIGGMEIPPVQDFLEPYRNGAQWANHDARVMITYADTFVDPDLGAQIAQDMIAGGADVIFGVAGPTGQGVLLEATRSGAWAIGVDSDQWLTIFDSGSVEASDRMLTSAMKRVDNAVYDAIADEVGGTFTSGTVLSDLASGGVGLAPFHEADPSIPQSVRDALETVEQGILSGSIDVWERFLPFHAYVPMAVRSLPAR